MTAFVNGGLRFSVVMATMDHLHFTTFHDAEDLDSVLSACQGVHQFARLGPKSNLDIEGLGIFSSYLAKMQKAWHCYNFVLVFTDTEADHSFTCIP